MSTAPAPTDPWTPDGLANFRDLGGLRAGGGRIRSGLLFRSDAVSYATQADADHLTGELHLATIVDLREEREIREFGRGPLAASDATYRHVPMGDVPAAGTRADFYATMLDVHGKPIAELIGSFGRPGVLPAIVHCHIGCDRTGIVIAAALGLLGVADADIAADYARSDRGSDPIRARSRQRRAALGLPQMPDAYYDAWANKPAVMEEMIARVRDRWGGFDGWAAAFGLDADEITALRSALIEAA